MKKDIYSILNRAKMDTENYENKPLSDSETENIMKKLSINSRHRNHHRVLIKFVGVAAAAAVIVAAASVAATRNDFYQEPVNSSSLSADLKNTEDNFFFLSASAEENVNSDWVAVREMSGCIPYTGTYFSVRGNNIKKVDISIDKGELYRGNARMIEYEKSSEYGSKYIGNSYTDENYNENTIYGIYINEKVYEKHENECNGDFKEAYHKCIDDIDGATLKVSVTFEDGTISPAEYSVKTGKIGIDTETMQPNGKMAQPDEPYYYGILLNKIK